MVKRRLILSAVLAVLCGGIKVDSALDLRNSDRVDQFRTVAGRVVISVNGEPAELAGMVRAESILNLGNGMYDVVFSHVPKETRYLEMTARVPHPHHSEEMVSQTLIVDISKRDHLEIPVNISTN
jgi:hypothetical protein